MFVNDAIVLADIAGMLSLADPSTLPSRWGLIVNLCHQRAYNDVVSALLARGYFIADVLNWGAGAAGQSYERSLSLFYSLSDGGGLEAYSDTFIKTFDCRESLKTVQIFDPAGKVILTEGGQVGTIGTGPMDVGCDVFPLSRNRFDCDGSWRGEW